MPRNGVAGECYAGLANADVYWLDAVRNILQGRCSTDTLTDDASVADNVSGYRMLCGVLRNVTIW